MSGITLAEFLVDRALAAPIERVIQVARKKMAAISRIALQAWQIAEYGAFHPAMAGLLVVTRQPTSSLDGLFNQVGTLAAPLLEG